MYYKIKSTIIMHNNKNLVINEPQIVFVTIMQINYTILKYVTKSKSNSKYKKHWKIKELNLTDFLYIIFY